MAFTKNAERAPHFFRPCSRLQAVIHHTLHPQQWEGRRALPATYGGRKPTLLIAGALELVDVLGRQMAEIAQPLQELLGPMAPQLEQLDSIPGVSEMTARDISAELGLDMARFGSASRLAAWAGLSPGNNESAGKRRRGRTRQGNRYLCRVLVQCAWATRKTSPFLGRTFRRLEARVGSKKAAVAVAHKILVIIDHLLLEGTLYEEERYDRLSPKREERERKQAIKALERLGYSMTLSQGDQIA